jgi:uncharacterized cofD-like protein
LFTSLLPNLLVANVAESIRRSNAITILVCNLMTQPGETDGFSACDHLRVVQACLGKDAVDFCLVNSAAVPAGAARYRDAGSQPVIADVDAIAALGVTPVEAGLFRFDDEKIRHDSAELARLIMAIAQGEAQLWRAAEAA